MTETTMFWLRTMTDVYLAGRHVFSVYYMVVVGGVEEGGGCALYSVQTFDITALGFCSDCGCHKEHI